MRKRKSIALWVMVFVAVAAIFAAGEGWAASDTCLVGNNVNLLSGECVNLSGYDVRVAKGLFPLYKNGNSIFKWAIVPGPHATKNLNLIDIKFPAAIQIGTFDQLKNSIKVSIIKPSPAILSYDFDKDDDDDDDRCGSPVNCLDLPFKGSGSGTEPGWYLHKAGIGEPVTGLGKGEFDYMVLKVIPSSGCSITTNSRAKIRVKFQNRSLFAGLDTFLVKAGDKAEGLNLLGPAQQARQATSPGSQPPINSGGSCKLGNTGCRMTFTLDSAGSLATAFVVPVGVDPANCGSSSNELCCGEQPPTPLPIENASSYFDCEKDGFGNPINCRQKLSASAGYCEELGGTCTYKTTVGGKTVTKIIPDPCAQL